MTGLVLLAAAVILLCLVLNRLSDKLGVPMLLAFILLGMLFGTDGILKIPFDNYEVAEQVCSISLIFIMFYGGFGTNWKQAKKVAGKAVLLSTVGVILTAVLTGVFCYFILKFEFWESMLIGAVISSTDAASVFSILRSKRLNLKYNTASLLEVESGSNDPCSYMLTVVILTIMSGEVSGGRLVLMIFLQVIFGILVGVLVSALTYFVLKRMHVTADGFDTIFVFGMALLSYAVASMIGGNGYLSVYIAGMILGNKPLQNKKSMVHFFDGITGLMQMLIFFLLGLLAFPSHLPRIMPYAFAIALFLTFVARPISVFAILFPFHCPVNQKILVSWSGLRGAASIVFAIMVMVSPAYTKNDVFHIVIFIVLFSISIQGTLLSVLAKKLDMIDAEGNVMKTFSDYSDEMPIDFIKIVIREGHPWANQLIKDISSQPDVLLVLVLRGKERIIPNGNTKLLEGDVVVLSALSPEEHLGLCLSEMTIEKDSELIGQSISKMQLGPDRLVLLLKRNEEVIIPNGATRIGEKDILVICEV